MEKLTQEIKDFIAEILDEEKQPELIDKLKAALENYESEIVTLQEDNTAKADEIIAKEAELETIKEENAALKIKFEELQTEHASLVEKEAQASEQLENIEKDNKAQDRVKQLVEAKLIKDDEETVSKYVEKVRDKEDADFEAYVQELTEIKETILAELEEKEDKDTDKAPTKTSDLTMAALNIEIQPSPDLTEKYRQMWEDEDK